MESNKYFDRSKVDFIVTRRPSAVCLVRNSDSFILLFTMFDSHKSMKVRASFKT